MKRILVILVMVFTLPAAAGEPRFSLSISGGGSSVGTISEEAQRALWNDPMAKLMRAADIELGRILVGQPGGRTPPAFLVGVTPGQPLHILGAAFENNLPKTAEPTTIWQWPWAPKTDEAHPTLEETFSFQLGQRLEQQVGVTADP